MDLWIIGAEDRELAADPTELAFLETRAIGHGEAHADHELCRPSAEPGAVIALRARITEELDGGGLLWDDPRLARERVDDRCASPW
ncbi:MAG TPA: hypothetical protein VFP56_12040 [Candidatus Limnocylindrales bacterium]|nr:hypothetical protein [Candidatus Limnocylindrales bacterium]